MHKKQHNQNYQIGEVYYMLFDGVGSEQSGMRPGVILQNNVGNKYSSNVIALPLTSKLKKLGQPTHVLVRADDSGMPKDSMVLAENPKSMPKERIGAFITKLSEEYMRNIAQAFLLATSAISYMDAESLIRAWEKARALNNIS